MPPINFQRPKAIPPADVVAEKEERFFGAWLDPVYDFQFVEGKPNAPSGKGFPKPSANTSGVGFDHYVFDFRFFKASI